MSCPASALCDLADYLCRNALLRPTTPLIISAASAAALKITPDAHTAAATAAATAVHERRSRGDRFMIISIKTIGELVALAL